MGPGSSPHGAGAGASEPGMHRVLQGLADLVLLRDQWPQYGFPVNEEEQAQQEAARVSLHRQAVSLASGCLLEDKSAEVLQRLLPSPEYPQTVVALVEQLKKPLPERLPVGNCFYSSLSDKAVEQAVQPVWLCSAERLAGLFTLLLQELPQVGDEQAVAAYTYDLIFKPLNMAAQLDGRAVMFDLTRSSPEPSTTSQGERPGRQVLLSFNGVLLMKGQVTGCEVEMELAKEDLVKKMTRFKSPFHREAVRYMLCFVACGSKIQFCCLDRATSHTIDRHDLGRPLNVLDMADRLKVLETTLKVYPILKHQALLLPTSSTIIVSQDSNWQNHS